MERATITDLDVGLPRPVEIVLKAATVRRADGGWRSLWRQSSFFGMWTERSLARQSAKADVDAVIMIQDIGRTRQPYFVVQDLSYGLLLSTFDGGSVPHFRTLSHDHIVEMRERQLEMWSGAAGLFPMSRWLADDMVASGVDPAKITVVPPGVNVEVAADVPVPARRTDATRRLLMVGRDFDTKAGDQVVAAFEHLRRRHGERIELTVIGPRTWPLESLPEGIDFRGPQPRAAVDAALMSHDLFVMPSRFEGFGIALVEALVRGLPCIGRRRCAMPEIIDECTGGRLVDQEDPVELADAIDSALGDDELYAACAELAQERRAYYTWGRAADQMVAAVKARGNAPGSDVTERTADPGDRL